MPKDKWMEPLLHWTENGNDTFDIDNPNDGYHAATQGWCLNGYGVLDTGGGDWCPKAWINDDKTHIVYDTFCDALPVLIVNAMCGSDVAIRGLAILIHNNPDRFGQYKRLLKSLYKTHYAKIVKEEKVGEQNAKASR